MSLGCTITAAATSAATSAARSGGTTADGAAGAGSPASELLVTPGPLLGPAEVACGLAGTVMRFVPPVAALADGPVTFDGDEAARLRPMETMLTALRTLGADVSPQVHGLPFTVHGTGGLRGGLVRLDGSASSQFVSGLLLAGARYDEGLDLRHEGKPIPSQPHLDMTVAMLRERGVSVDDAEPNRWVVAPGAIAAHDADIEPDLSSAAPFLAAALVTGGRVTVRGWPGSTTQPGAQLPDLLTRFGGHVEWSGDCLTLTGPDKIEGVDLDLHDVGELTPVLAALAALAQGPSHLRGIAHLRGHETNRLAALAHELSALGGGVVETDDGLDLTPAPLHGGAFHTYGDHRMAQAGAVLGLVVDAIVLDDVATTAKTFPDFERAWADLLAAHA